MRLGRLGGNPYQSTRVVLALVGMLYVDQARLPMRDGFHPRAAG
jgi:hypothetical protein